MNKESRIKSSKMENIDPVQVSIKVEFDGRWILKLNGYRPGKTPFIPAHGKADNPKEAFEAAYKAAQDLASW